MTTQTSVCELVVREVISTINRRDFDEAVRVASAHASDNRHTCENLDFWFYYSLALRLSLRNVAADEAWKKAQLCPGYPGIIEEGDCMRDSALMHLRDGLPFICLASLNHIESRQHEDADENRRILLGALKGRAYVALAANACDEEQRRILVKRAFRYYRDADTAWRIMEAGQANQQWVNNNLFHWLRLESVLGNVAYRGDDSFSWFYNRFMSNERSLKRRIAARLMWRLGPIGVRIADRMDTTS